jgi:DNA-binding NarL/FixJ family response regulator
MQKFADSGYNQGRNQRTTSCKGFRKTQYSSDEMEERAPMSSLSEIAIMIVDDHPLFRDGLHATLSLETDINIVAECSDGEEALRLAELYTPDVVVLDVNLPTLNGLQVTHALRGSAAPPAIVILTAYHDSEQVLHAMRAGASAYCAKDITPKELVEIIRSTAEGYFVVGSQRMDASAAQRWISRGLEALLPNSIDPEEHFSPLSPREMEILQFVTNGMSNKQIASRLSISQQTVKNHMTSILKKLNVQDRTQAAVTALRHGWVRLPIESPELRIPDAVDANEKD